MKTVEEIVREVIENKNEVTFISIREFLKQVQSHKEIKEELINKLVEAVENCTLVQDIKFDTKILTEAKKHEVSLLYKRIKRAIADQEREVKKSVKNYDKMDTKELLIEILMKLDKITR